MKIKEGALASPKEPKVSQRTHQPPSWQRAGSPGALTTVKSKKHSLQSARLTVEKFLKKRVADLALFTKGSGAVASGPHALSSLKVGEAITNLTKSATSRAVSHMEIAQLLKGSLSTHLASKKKRGPNNPKSALSQIGQRQPQTRHVFSGMPPHAKQPMMASYLGSGARPSGRGSQPAGKAGRRSSQSRLDTLESGPAFFSKKSYQLPVHKIKKRLKQHLANHSLQSLQQSLLPVPHENRADVRYSHIKTALSRSKSRSPVKKPGSRIGAKGRPMVKRVATKIKKPCSFFEQSIATGSVTLDAQSPQTR